MSAKAQFALFDLGKPDDSGKRNVPAPVVSTAELESVIELKYRLFDDGIRRWRDLDIAEWLGLEVPYRIRETLQKRQAELERHGKLLTLDVKSGGRPGTEYHLNFKQTMRYFMWSITPRAMDVQAVMVDVFEKVVIGELTLAPRMEQRAVAVEAAKAVAAFIMPVLMKVADQSINAETGNAKVLTILGEMLTKMPPEVTEAKNEILDKVDGVEKKLDVVVDDCKSRRKEVSSADRRTIIECLRSRRHGVCPCCERIAILDAEGNPNDAFTIDHWFSRYQAGIDEVWPGCRECNELLKNSKFKLDRASQFKTWQDLLANHLQPLFEGLPTIEIR